MGTYIKILQYVATYLCSKMTINGDPILRLLFMTISFLNFKSTNIIINPTFDLLFIDGFIHDSDKLKPEFGIL
jgi:hypothetical protein